MSPTPEERAKKELTVEPPMKKVRRRGRPPLSEKIEREKSEKVLTPVVHTQQVQVPVATASPAKQPPVRMENEVKLPELNFEKTLSVQVGKCCNYATATQTALFGVSGTWLSWKSAQHRKLSHC